MKINNVFILLILLIFIDTSNSATVYKAQQTISSTKYSTTSGTPPTNSQHQLEFVPTVIGVTKTIVCGSEKCQKVIEYAIASNYTFNCNEEFLPIIFEVTSQENKKYLSFGYLPKDGILVQKSQKTNGVCRKIRRFDVNENQNLIVIGDSIELVDILKSDDMIYNQLLKNNQFLLYFLIKIGKYDEENDSIFYLEGLKDIICFAVCLQAFFFLYIKIQKFFKCISLIMEESTKNSLKCKPKKN